MDDLLCTKLKCFFNDNVNFTCTRKPDNINPDSEESCPYYCSDIITYNKLEVINENICH